MPRCYVYSPTWKKDPNAHEQIGTINVCIEEIAKFEIVADLFYKPVKSD